MATTISLTPVVAGVKALATDLNTPFTSVQNFLNSIDGDNIQTNTIPGDRIKANSVAGTKLLDACITVGKLGNAAVTTVKLGGNVVTAAKLGTSAVTTVKITDAAVTFAKAFAGSATCGGFGKTQISSYTGDGSASHAITDVGWTPAAVLVTSCGGANCVLKIAGMSGTDSQNITGGTKVAGNNGILSLDASGFTVGNYNSVNGLGITFWYIALART